MSELLSLLDLLKPLLPDSSSSSLRSYIRHGRVAIQGKICKRANEMFPKSSSVKLLSTGEVPKKKISGIPIIYEDSRFIAIDKPAGMLSVPASGRSCHALGLLKGKSSHSHIYPVHRIDKGTSGLMIFAKGRESEESFDKIFEKHAIIREYLAIVEGNVKDDSGSLYGFIKEKSIYEMVIDAHPNGGKHAVSHFKVLKRSGKFSYLLFSLETGRKHQIRIQCKAMGHCIIGDFLYGSTCNPIKRIALHAHRLSFVHPFTQHKMDLYSQTPSSFLNLGCPKKLK